MKFEELHKQATEDLKIDQFDLTAESLRGPNIFSKYLGMLRDEKFILKKLENAYKVMFRDKVLCYIGEADDEIYEKYNQEQPQKRILKTEVSMYTDADQDLMDLTDRLTLQKEKVQYLERVVKYIENRNFAIKNAIDYLKFTQGT